MGISKRLNWVVALVGVWAIVSPFILGYWLNNFGLVVTVGVGISLVVFGVWAALTNNDNSATTLDVLNFLIGAFMILAPFFFDLYIKPAPVLNLFLAGLVVVILELGCLFTLFGRGVPVE